MGKFEFWGVFQAGWKLQPTPRHRYSGNYHIMRAEKYSYYLYLGNECGNILFYRMWDYHNLILIIQLLLNFSRHALKMMCVVFACVCFGGCVWVSARVRVRTMAFRNIQWVNSVIGYKRKILWSILSLIESHQLDWRFILTDHISQKPIYNASFEDSGAHR